MAITDNLVAYWDLSEASGQRNDSISTNHLSDNDTVTGTTGPGIHNASFFVLANTEWLSLTDNANISVSDIDFTIATWAKFTTIFNGMAIISHGTGPGRSWQIFVNSVPRIVFLVSNNGTATAEVPANNFGAPSTATWYFIVAWHDSVANTINIQINNGTPNSLSHTTGVFDGTGDLNIGDREGGGWWFDGGVALTGIWKGRLLTADEKTWLYNSGNGRSYAEMASIPIKMAQYRQRWS